MEDIYYGFVTKKMARDLLNTDAPSFYKLLWGNIAPYSMSLRRLRILTW